MLLGLWGCTGPLVDAPAALPSAMPPGAPITQISIERDCFGCAGGSLLVLRADGSAQRVQRGHARHGALDVVTHGAGRAADFAALARFVQVQQFFAMADEYQDPDLRDGPWTLISVTRGDQEKRVFKRDEAGPDALKLLQSRIDAVAAGITFKSAPP